MAAATARATSDACTASPPEARYAGRRPPWRCAAPRPGLGVPRCWANRLTRNSSSIHRTARTSGSPTAVLAAATPQGRRRAGALARPAPCVRRRLACRPAAVRAAGRPPAGSAAGAPTARRRSRRRTSDDQFGRAGAGRRECGQQGGVMRRSLFSTASRPRQHLHDVGQRCEKSVGQPARTPASGAERARPRRVRRRRRISSSTRGDGAVVEQRGDAAVRRRDQDELLALRQAGDHRLTGDGTCQQQQPPRAKRHRVAAARAAVPSTRRATGRALVDQRGEALDPTARDLLTRARGSAPKSQSAARCARSPLAAATASLLHRARALACSAARSLPSPSACRSSSTTRNVMRRCAGTRSTSQSSRAHGHARQRLAARGRAAVEQRLLRGVEPGSERGLRRSGTGTKLPAQRLGQRPDQRGDDLLAGSPGTCQSKSSARRG